MLLPVRGSLLHLPQIKICRIEQEDWRSGKSLKISMDRLNSPSNPHSKEAKNLKEIVVVIDCDGEVAGIANLQSCSVLKPKVVFKAKG